MEEKESRFHQIYTDSQGIVNIKIAEGAHVDIEALKYINRKTQELTGKKKVLALIDARQFHTMTPEASTYLKSEMIDKTRLASAVLSKKVATSLVVDNLKVQKAKSPVRMFSSEAQARAWLISVKKKSEKK